MNELLSYLEFIRKYNNKKGMLNVLLVWWKVYDKIFYSLFKDKVTELCLSSLLCPFIIIWKENDVFSSESS